MVDPEVGRITVAGSYSSLLWKCLVDETHPNYERPANQMVHNFTGRCPYCVRARVAPGITDLGTLFPEIADSLVDQSLRSILAPKSNRVVEWFCLQYQEHPNWKTAVGTRTHQGTGCPVCSGNVFHAGLNDMATKYPELVEELVRPEEAKTISFGSETKLEWRCKIDPVHTWMSIPRNRWLGRGCPVCAKSGYKDDEPACLYVTTSEDIGGLGPIVKYGIANVIDVRLVKHVRRGFLRTPLLVVDGDGAEIRALEYSIKKTLADLEVKTCAELGIDFDGKTESFPIQNFSVKKLFKLITQESQVRGLNYGYSDQARIEYLG